MKKSEKKELLNNWPSMSSEEREAKLLELEETLSEKKYKKILASISKIEKSLEEDQEYYEEYGEAQEDQPTDNYQEEVEVTFDEKPEVETVVQEETYFPSTEPVVEEETIVTFDDKKDGEEVIHENWVIEDNELHTSGQEEKGYDFVSESTEPELQADQDMEYGTPVNFSEFSHQIGSDERAWNRNAGIIYSQEELIYRLSNARNISDDEYRLLLISAQKKIEFIQLLIEKSRIKNAAYSYDFLNSMCWRVDKALKTFLEANKR
ncbi:MAG: hypothetical protein ACRCVI_02035 [Mycoplasmoidaceae bacterium]